MAPLDPIMLRTYDYGLIPPDAAGNPAWQGIPLIPLVPARYSAQARLFPSLVTLGDLTPDQRAALPEASQAQEVDDPPLISALVSAPPAIRAHLPRALVIGRIPNGDRLLRFYDPRVYQHLRWILTADQHAWLLGPATAWTWPDRDGQWRTDTRAETAEAERAEHYSPAQLAQFDRIEYIERAYRRLARTHPQVVTSEAEAVPQLDRVLAEAMDRDGLSADRDLDPYVDHVMTVHRHIHSHPDMQARLARIARGQSYRGACRDLDAATLAHYADELDRRDAPTPMRAVAHPKG